MKNLTLPPATSKHLPNANSVLTFRLRKSPPKVRPHAKRVWTVCIGKAISGDKKKLRAKDWYFGGCAEADANKQASKIAERWNFIVRNWGTLYQPTLAAIESAFASIPHWQPAIADKIGPSDDAIDADQRQRPSSNEIAEAYGNLTLGGLFGLYKVELQTAVANADKGKTTTWTDQKNIRGAMAYLDEKMRLDALTATEIAQAKTAMLGKLSRRTASNYLEAFKRMLNWFYDSDYGKGWDRLSNFDKVFSVRKATKTTVEIPTPAELKIILAAADEWQRLIGLLGLNCGMYQADIGRLTIDEFDLAEGYVFWDREKQPSNAFKVRHDLWPETLRHVKKFIQPMGTTQRFSTDFRGHTPTQVDCSTLAFVDGDGNPLYRVRENGKGYDKIDKSWQRLGDKRCKFMSLRKATNQVLTDLLNNKIDGDERGGLIAVQEISDMFLGHKSAELERVYRTRGVQGYGRLNKYLAEVGNAFRNAEVFQWDKPNGK